jgi:DNA-binding XRE family transcriptional regulator/predicted RNase H-like HicB family nuclease
MEYLAVTRKEGKRTLLEFPDCPGCQTFAEPHESVADIGREALEGWLELHLEDGDAPPRPSRRVKTTGRVRSLAIHVDASLAIRLQIRWARQDAGLSQGDLAKRIGVTRQQISLLEGRGRNLTVATLRRIADALNLDLAITLSARAA